LAEPTLLAVLEVEQAQRIRCQAPACNHGVHRAIHVIQSDEGIKLYGSQCCAKLFGWTSKQRAASYTTTGRKLTAEERAQLESNTASLLEKLRFEHEQRQEEIRQKLRSLKAVFEQRAQASAVESAKNRPVKRTLGTVLDPEVERRAKSIVSKRYQVDADLPGWRGLVLQEAKKIEDEHHNDD
jgi:hypothetical protein